MVVSSIQSTPAPSASTRCAYDSAACYTDGMSTELVASAGVIEEIRKRGGALYVWPRKQRCCGGTITLEAATEPPERAFRRIETVAIDLFVPVGMMSPFGGLAFMADGHIACGITGDELMLRLGADGADGAEAALRRPHVRPMDFIGRPLKGMVFVEPSGLRGAALGRWVTAATTFARTLPPKR